MTSARKTSSDAGGQFSASELRKMQSYAVTASTEEFLQEVHARVSASNLSEDEVFLLAELVAGNVFPLAWGLPWKASTFEGMADVIREMAGQPGLSEPAVRVLVDGWCDEMLVHAHRKVKTVADVFFPRWEKVFIQVAQLAAHPVCPLGLAGRLWRMTYVAEKHMTVSDDILQAVVANPEVPSAFALRLHVGQKSYDPAMVEKSVAFQRAQEEHPDIAELPVPLFLNVMLSQPFPAEWHGEMGQDFTVVKVLEPPLPHL